MGLTTSIYQRLKMWDIICRINELNNEFKLAELSQGHNLQKLRILSYVPESDDKQYHTRHKQGTGRWLLDSDEFQRWSNESGRTLFCPGIPGAGKTMIASIVVEHLWAEFRNDLGISIAYPFCNFRRQQEQKHPDLLASLLKRLVRRRPSVPANVRDLYKLHNDQRTRPSFGEISRVLHSVVADYSRAFIVDALDERQVSNGGCRRLLSEMFDLQARTGACLFATSRLILEIARAFEGSISLEARASDKDVQRYLDGHMSRLPSFVLHGIDLQGEIKAEIIRAVDGVYVPSCAVTVDQAS